MFFCADHHLKDKREREYSSIEEELDISVSDIRNKIVGEIVLEQYL